MTEREEEQARRQVRGLLLVAAIVLALSMWRYGAKNLLTPGWWRIW